MQGMDERTAREKLDEVMTQMTLFYGYGSRRQSKTKACAPLYYFSFIVYYIYVVHEPPFVPYQVTDGVNV